MIVPGAICRHNVVRVVGQAVLSGLHGVCTWEVSAIESRPCHRDRGRGQGSQHQEVTSGVSGGTGPSRGCPLREGATSGGVTDTVRCFDANRVLSVSVEARERVAGARMIDANVGDWLNLVNSP